MRIVVVKKIGFLLSLIAFLIACSQYTSNGERYYSQSKNGATVTVPPPLTDTNISHFYDLPQQNQNPQVSIAPPVKQRNSQAIEH